MRTTFLLAVLSSLILAAAAAARDNTPFSDSGDPLTMAVYGDAPYGTTPTDTAEFRATPAFIDSVNADKDVRLILHVGDIHSGKQFCTQAYDQSIYDLWTAYQAPLVYTPGDNEWTDCHKTGEGGNVLAGGQPVDYANGNPVANLALVRSIFFSNPGHALGQRDKVLLSQADAFDPAHPGDAAFVENVMWEQSRTLFVTIDLPGGSNDDTDPWYGVTPVTQAQLDERASRDGADLRWLDKAFAIAQDDPQIRAVVIGLQADMWDPENGAAHQSQYEPYVARIAAGTAALRRPVLLINGDSHVYQSDNPLQPGDPNYFIHPGYDVPNFHRIVVHGSTFPLEWLKLRIDPRADNPTTGESFGPFSWTREIQPQP